MPPKGKSASRAATSLHSPARTSSKTTSSTATPSRGRGRPKKATDATPEVAAEPAAKGKRGRPKTVAVEESAAPTKGKRGRPAKPVEEETVTPAKGKRGRPKTTAAAPAANTAAKRKRDTEDAAEAEPPRKRGRPKGSTNGVTPNKKIKVVKKKSTSAMPRGRPRKPTATNVDTEVTDAASETEGDENDAGVQYWLMKAEPDTRIENGHDVSFPIDKLAMATEPEPWDGVRNYQARNTMRAMRKGDLAFFYHSNCDVPGIVGIMRIAVEHGVDESAFDPSHPYYDPKSDRAAPKWDCVKVEFVKKFDNIVSLKTLKSTPALKDMQIASKSFSRLSVQSVRPKEWAIVLQMAGEASDDKFEKEGKPLPKKGEVKGYEAGTDGETERNDTVNGDDGAGDDESVGIDDAEAERMSVGANGQTQNGVLANGGAVAEGEGDNREQLGDERAEDDSGDEGNVDIEHA